jgi:hypothetical protein
MTKIVNKNDPPTTKEPLTGKEKLEQLKAHLFPPATKAQRVLRALDSLHKAIQSSHLEMETIKHIAQDADLEGF